MSASIVRRVRPELRRFAALSVVWAIAVGPAPLSGQSGDATLTGRVSDAASNEAISGARVFVPGTVMSTSTRLDGTYRLRLVPGTHEVRVTYIGYSIGRDTVQVEGGASLTRDYALAREPLALEELAVVGTRAAERTSTEAPVPVDVLTAAEIKQTGRTETSQIIQALAPSFNFPRATISDGTDHTRPATLRGLAPDQVLVLVNGKRRHGSALINVNGSIGRGSGMVDLNAIPASSIERIEILRDGAAAQYGSDAIAGVINIILKQAAPNELGTTFGQTVESDGGVIQAGGNYALAVGGDGVLQIAGEYRNRGFTNRSAADRRTQYLAGDPRNGDPALNGLINHRQGDADTQDGGLFLNLAKPVTDAVEVYAFGGGTLRSGESAGFFRRALDDRTIRAIYPNGFLPIIGTKISDFSGVAGLRGEQAGWRWDVSADYGRNLFHFDVRNSANVTLGAASPTEFYAGTLKSDQFTANLDVAKSFVVGLASPLNVAVGGEFRRDGYHITEGEPDSYRDGGVPILDGPNAGAQGAPGAQVFPGFRPGDATDRSRHNVAGYIDLEAQVVRKLLVGVAGRAENYNDFGSTTDGKVTARFEPIPGFAVRGAVSTGFKAPSLGQSFFSATSTNFINGQPFDNRTFPVTSAVARALGASDLTPEQSTNYSFGVALNPVKNLSVTADYYQILIDDRIVFSGNFTGAAIRTFLENAGFPGVAGGRFFTNAIDTRTLGVDIVANYGFAIGGTSTLRLTGGFNYNVNRVLRVAPTPAALSAFQETLFDRVERARIEVGQPKDNLYLSGVFNYQDLGFTLRTQRFGEVTSFGTDPTGVLDQTFSAKWITDVNASYTFGGRFTLAAGVDNVFDVYPDENALGDATTAGTNNFGIFPFNQISPFGFNGAFYYGRLTFGF
ncbi:MAG: iron complex outerrane recepter protein [Gemmatimonadales bacterium]|nr:iron complex outerrane recepter protein [Gemmatimonadales bacterium]